MSDKHIYTHVDNWILHISVEYQKLILFMLNKSDTIFFC